MYCTRCKQQIPDHLDVCPLCAREEHLECHHCKAVLSAEAIFCSQCGSKLNKRSVSVIQDPRTLQTQRRHLTVMFCDLVGSTGISTQIDPEDLSELLVEYRDLCMGVVKKWDGYVADFAGDGVMIYFGYPTAHEDDSLRAVYAGLEIVEQITANALKRAHANFKLAVRIGINSGRAVIGDIGTGDVVESMGIVGETPNIASKLQSRAGNNEIVVSETTYRNVQGFFSVKSLGRQSIKGVDKEVKAYKVICTLEQTERFGGKRYLGLNPFTDREDEILILKSNWENIEKGRFVSMAIIGEAGIGKSRLLWAFREWLEPKKHSTIVFNCSAYHTQTALYPFIELISRGAGGDKAKSEKHLRLLFKKLKCFDEVTLESNIQVLLDFIYGQTTERDPEKYKSQIYDIFTSLAQSLSRQSPLLIVVEDLHWIDPTSREFLLRVLSSGSLSNVCLLLTSRQTRGEIPVDVVIDLKPLDDDYSAELIDGIIAKTKLPHFLLNQLVDSCNGNPLYLEESAKYLLETDILEKDYTRQKLHLISENISFAPESLHDLFMSRLDRLSNEKWLVQLACAIGRQFDKNIL